MPLKRVVVSRKKNGWRYFVHDAKGKSSADRRTFTSKEEAVDAVYQGVPDAAVEIHYAEPD